MSLFPRYRTFESLKFRDYRYLWLGQLGTSMGQWMDNVARGWLIYDITHSAFQLGLVTAVRGLPILMFGAIAGAVADRYGRKAQLVISQTVNALLNIILALLILTGRVEPWHIYVTGFLSGSVQAFQQPARQVLVSDLVGERHLLNAIALNATAFNTSRSIGPAVGGLLISAFGVGVSYFVQAGLFALATVWTVQMRVPPQPAGVEQAPGAAAGTLLGSTRVGLSYILSHRPVLAMLVLGLAPMALGMPFISLMPVFAIDVFHGGAPLQGFLLTAVGIGAVVGSLGIASLGNRQINKRLMVISAAAFGLSLALFARSPWVGMAMVFALLAGISNSSYTSQNQTIIQLTVPRELRGRVLGVYLLNRGLMPVGSLLAGLLASVLGGPWAVTVMGMACFVLVIAVAIWEPALWRTDLAKSSQ